MARGYGFTPSASYLQQQQASQNRYAASKAGAPTAPTPQTAAPRQPASTPSQPWNPNLARILWARSGVADPVNAWRNNPYQGGLAPTMPSVPRPGTAQPVQPPSQGTPYGQPGGGRLEDTNPALWNESQWSEYETRHRNSGLADSGGYYRDKQGNVRYSGGLSGPGPIITPQTQRDQYGFWRANPAPPGPGQPTVGGWPDYGTPNNRGLDIAQDRQRALQDSRSQMSDEQMQAINRQRWEDWKQKHPGMYDANGRLRAQDAGPATLSRGADGRIYDKPSMVPASDKYLYKEPTPTPRYFGDDVRYGPTPPTSSPQGQSQDPMTQMWQQSMNAWAMPKQQLMQWGQQVSQMPWGPNYANSPDGRPDPYSIGVQGAFGNSVQDMWNNMGGFIQSVNNQAMQKPVGVYQGQGNPGAQYGKVNYDIRSLINQGNQMVQNGWQNPFTPGGAAQPQWPTAPWSLQTGPAWAGYPQ